MNFPVFLIFIPIVLYFVFFGGKEGDVVNLACTLHTYVCVACL